jgi:hypothetical protein
MRHLLSLVAAAGFAAFASAQDAVTLHSVTWRADDTVAVVYSKNFATCAHMRFGNATCSQTGAMTHTQNLFCAQGTNVIVVVPTSAFVAGFDVGDTVYMVHGNNSGVASPCVPVGYDGAYGPGCVGSNGVPSLTTNGDAPLAGSAVAFTIANGVPASIAVLGFATDQVAVPVIGCTLLIFPVLGVVSVPFDAAGSGTFVFPTPPSAVGVQFAVQAFALDPAGPQGFSATVGREIRVR